MLTKSSWLHLRIPFSYFLLPVYLFSLAVSPNLSESRMLWVFIILHVFLYPASNGFNSYFDKDEGSIGGLKNPPPVHKGLYTLALVFDGLALVFGILKINLLFTGMLLVYGLASKAYSHPSIRLKKYAFLGWVVTGFFQGFFTFMMCYVGINDFAIENALTVHIVIPAVLTSFMLWGNYPMTQIYQHVEDAIRGDISLSIKLGIRGTFIFSALFFLLAAGGFTFYFSEFFSIKYAVHFLLALMPVLIYFGFWYVKVVQRESNANYKFAMRLNFISATCLNIFFIYFFLDNSQVLQAIRAGY